MLADGIVGVAVVMVKNIVVRIENFNSVAEFNAAMLYGISADVRRLKSRYVAGYIDSSEVEAVSVLDGFEDPVADTDSYEVSGLGENVAVDSKDSVSISQDVDFGDDDDDFSVGGYDEDEDEAGFSLNSVVVNEEDDSTEDDDEDDGFSVGGYDEDEDEAGFSLNSVVSDEEDDDFSVGSDKEEDKEGYSSNAVDFGEDDDDFSVGGADDEDDDDGDFSLNTASSVDFGDDEEEDGISNDETNDSFDIDADEDDDGDFSLNSIVDDDEEDFSVGDLVDPGVGNSESEEDDEEVQEYTLSSLDINILEVNQFVQNEFEEVTVEEVVKREVDESEVQKILDSGKKDVTFVQGMSLVAFLKANPTIRDINDVLGYFRKNEIDAAIRRGEVFSKRGGVLKI